MPESIHSFLFSYYGLDWAAAIFMFLSMHRLGQHKKDGFVLAALASFCWIAFNLIVNPPSPAGVTANVIIAIMAFRSLSTWNKTHPGGNSPATSEDE
ncbi:MAG: hypothetical protein KUG81_07325 [Gammaproteobacteria bacterium]|nr:hypothetical protein [Gammaproteobacteria bacterium]